MHFEASNDGSVLIETSFHQQKVRAEHARDMARELILAADRAERMEVCFDPHTGEPPRPGRRAQIVAPHGRPDTSHDRRVHKVIREGLRDEVWLDDDTGPFIRQSGTDRYRLCDDSHVGSHGRYLALTDEG